MTMMIIAVRLYDMIHMAALFSGRRNSPCSFQTAKAKYMMTPLLNMHEMSSKNMALFFFDMGLKDQRGPPRQIASLILTTWAISATSCTRTISAPP